jgi:hypothetical protein
MLDRRATSVWLRSAQIRICATSVSNLCDRGCRDSVVCSIHRGTVSYSVIDAPELHLVQALASGTHALHGPRCRMSADALSVIQGQEEFKGNLSSSDAMEFAGQVLHGTCGWSDPSIVACGKFYPRSVKTSADKLQVHSKTFGCVEVR